MDPMQHLNMRGPSPRVAPESTLNPPRRFLDLPKPQTGNRTCSPWALALLPFEVRQEWYRDYVLELGEDPLPFVGSMTVNGVERIASSSIVAFLGTRLRTINWPEPRSHLFDVVVDMAEAIGILVMTSPSVVEGQLGFPDGEEVLGLTLVDDLAPLIVINERLPKDEQLLTLARHLALLWLGKSGVSTAASPVSSDGSLPRFCDVVAREVVAGLRQHVAANKLVVPSMPAIDGWLAVATRSSRTFTRALICNTGGSSTTYISAFRMLGVKSTDVFHAIGRSLGLEL